MLRRIITMGLAALFVGGCAPDAAKQAFGNWVHPDLRPGAACNAPRAPQNSQDGAPKTPEAQRVLGHWEGGFWARQDGKLAEGCVNITVLAVDSIKQTARVHLGFSGHEEPWIAEASFNGKVISHEARNGLKFWIRAGEEGVLQVRFDDNPDGIFFATLRRAS